MKLCENSRTLPAAAGLCGHESPSAVAATRRDWHDNSRTKTHGKPVIPTAPRGHWLSTALIFAVLTATSPAWAQTTDTGTEPLAGRPIPIAELATQAPALLMWDGAARHAELQKWMADFSAWKDWAITWGNRREPGWFSDSRARRPRPDPPVWLFQECEGLSPDSREEACQLLAEWSGGAALMQTAAGQAVNTAAEDSQKITWWEHVHLDAGWPALQSGIGVYGVLGVHATTTVKGRLQIFIAPGAMLLNVPTEEGCDHEALQAAGVDGNLISSLNRGLGKCTAARDLHRMSADGACACPGRAVR